MAQDIGLLLRGLGASFSQQVPQFRQEMAQEQALARQQQALADQQRQRQRQTIMEDYEFKQQVEAAGYQDGLALLNYLRDGNLEAGLNLLENRMQTMKELEQELGIKFSNDPTASIYEDVRRSITGDPEALQRAQTQTALVVAAGFDKGLIKLPEATKGVVVGDRLVNPITGGVIFEPPMAPKPETTRTPESPIGKMMTDINLGFIPPDLGQQLIGAQLSEAQRQQAESAQKSAATLEQQSMQNAEVLRAYELANKLASDPNIGAIFGTVSSRTPTLKASSGDLEVALDELKNLLTMGNLGRMSGVLSQSDIELIASAASGLDLRMSDEAAKQKLNQITRRLETKLREKGIEIPSAQAPTAQTATQSRSIFNWGDL
jgi:hypothetical protein